ncbi:hypothetical protein GR168_22600 [Gordonia sp. JH63]|uniref:Uncharacterized protein n=1 Tax=Gordonia hongkongensis TaxID=1701090 RepID=A0AAX3T7J0_9ACTN|nr:MULTISPECIES: hypothetical protein [Gordonia]QIK46122.1 hypothetical protein G8C36_01940 [Gordonia terrae]MBR7194728.1 hypothetical protein [Gordonia sp. SCSIO 19800]MDF6099447.1 hypothetical protein [Gordonia hongkongensis]QHD87863.1 hypothetical protein GR168_22600 [Gordonia sp. JH63]UCZ88254.1 hypothetical protein LEL84_14160 [Gordonia sp. WA4-43]
MIISLAATWVPASIVVVADQDENPEIHRRRKASARRERFASFFSV